MVTVWASTSAEDGTQTQMSDNSGDHRADVELRLPAEGAYATVVRTTAAGLAARLDFTIDDIEDLRIAIGEASGRSGSCCCASSRT